MSSTIRGIDLQDKVVLVTGAARGIGAAIAQRCAEAGASVMVTTGSSEADARAVVAAIESAGGKADFRSLDVRDNEQWQSVVDDTVDIFGGLDVLVNNAGIGTLKLFVDMSLQDLQQTMGINLDGAFLGMQQAIRVMRPGGGAGNGGSIVNVSSAASRLGSPGEYIDYAASKGAIDTMTIGLSKEVASEGIRVNAVRPGIIETDIHASGGEPGRVDRIGPMLPMGRGGTAQEIAETILWLASEEASYVTGSFIEASGGR